MRTTIVVASRGRPGSVRRSSQLFPDAMWCVSVTDAPDYDVPAARKLIHPDDVVGIARKRQWILDNTAGPVFMVDDDIAKVWCNVGVLGRTVEGPENIRRLIENAATIAEAIGAPVFGFDQTWDVRKFNPMDPVKFTGWVGTAWGFISREICFDQGLQAQAEDIDYCLQCLLKKRLIYVDQRFAFVNERFTNRGGLAGIRSQEKYQACVDHMTRKWGRWVSVRKVKTTVRILPCVPRRQVLDLEI